MCKTGQDVVVAGIPHHPVSQSQQQTQPARGETHGPGQGRPCRVVSGSALSCFESGRFWFQFAYGAEGRRRGPGGCGQAGKGKDVHVFGDWTGMLCLLFCSGLKHEGKVTWLPRSYARRTAWIRDWNSSCVSAQCHSDCFAMYT